MTSREVSLKRLLGKSFQKVRGSSGYTDVPEQINFLVGVQGMTHGRVHLLRQARNNRMTKGMSGRKPLQNGPTGAFWEDSSTASTDGDEEASPLKTSIKTGKARSGSPGFSF